MRVPPLICLCFSLGYSSAPEWLEPVLWPRTWLCELMWEQQQQQQQQHGLEGHYDKLSYDTMLQYVLTARYHIRRPSRWHALSGSRCRQLPPTATLRSIVRRVVMGGFSYIIVFSLWTEPTLTLTLFLTHAKSTDECPLLTSRGWNGWKNTIIKGISVWEWSPAR